MRTYDYKGYIPYGAGQLLILDNYVDPDFSGNVPSEIMENGGAWDKKKLVMVMPSGLEVDFRKA